MKALLTDAEKTRVAEAIAEVENETAGEIVVHVVDRSDDYAALRWLYAGAFAFVLVQALVVAFPEALGPYALPAIVPAAVLGFWGLGLSGLLARLLPAPAAARAVHARAHVAFVENRVHRTRDASGVLILISQLEHRVEILADEGIHERVGVEGWEKHLSPLLAEIRAGRALDGVLGCIKAIGEDLAKNFPPRPDDVDELPNEVVVTKD